MTLFQRSRTVINQQQQTSINIRFFQSSTLGKVRKNRDKQSLRQGSSPEASCICTYQKTKRKQYQNITPQKCPAGCCIMKRHTWLIGVVLLSCGQIPVTKWQSRFSLTHYNPWMGWMIFFFASRFYKIAADSSYFRKKMLHLQMKELLDSIAM